MERFGWLLEEIRSQWNWAPGSSFLNNPEFSLNWPQTDWSFKAGLADMPNCLCRGSGQEETALHAFNNFEWTVRIDFKQLVLLDVGYVVDNVDPSFRGEKPVVFLVMILAVARMVIWTTRKKGLYDGANFSHRGVILFFRHQLESKSEAIENA